MLCIVAHCSFGYAIIHLIETQDNLASKTIQGKLQSPKSNFYIDKTGFFVLFRWQYFSNRLTIKCLLQNFFPRYLLYPYPQFKNVMIKLCHTNFLNKKKTHLSQDLKLSKQNNIWLWYIDFTAIWECRNASVLYMYTLEESFEIDFSRAVGLLQATKSISNLLNELSHTHTVLLKKIYW